MIFPFSTRISNGDSRFDRLEEVEGVQLNPALDDHYFTVPDEAGPDFTVAHTFPYTIPFRLISNLVVVDAVINGETRPFILDSGTINVLFPQTINELGLASEGVFSGFGGGQNEVTTSQIRVDALEFASAYFRPQIFMVYPFPTVRKVMGVPNLAGLLGYEIFKRFVITIDYPHRKITFSLPATYHYSGHGDIVPFHFFKNAIEVDATIDSIPSRLIVDIGNTGSLILNSPWVNGHRPLFPNAFEKIQTATADTGGEAKFAFAAVKTLSIGDRTFRNITAALSMQSAGATANPYSDGIAGAALFVNSVVIFDYTRHCVIFENGKE